MNITPFSLKSKVALILVLAISIRLAYINYVVPVDWIGDSYHHWQIAIYTLKIGLPLGRMWDLKGVEYYWPPLPTLIEASLMGIIGNTSINIMRFLNTLIGSFSVLLAYLIGTRYSKNAGITAASILLFFPLTLNTEVLALHEPLMGLFFLMGLLFFGKGMRFYSGTMFGLSYLCHFSVYLTVPLILAMIIFKERKVEKILPFILGFFLVYIPYMFFLGAKTGDPLYNIRTMLTYIGVSTATMRHPLANILGYLFIPLGIVLLYLMSRRDVSTIESILPMTLLGGYLIFWGYMFLFIGAPLSLYELRYYWIPLVLGVLSLSELVDRVSYFKAPLFFGLSRISVICFVISVSMLFVLSPNFSELQNPILWDFQASDRVANYYEKGTIISPVPHMTYRLIHDWNILPKNILGPIYCPIALDEKIRWLEANNVTLIYWLPDMEADRVFPELSSGLNVPPFFVLEKLGYDRYIYEFSWN